MANTTATTKKVTKAQRNSDIMTILQIPGVAEALAAAIQEGTVIPHGTTIEDAVAHLTKENDLLSRKNKSGGTKKLTKDQEANERYKDDIRAFFQANPTRLVSANEVMMEVFMTKYPDKLWSNQKTASLLNAMADKLDKEGNVTDDSGELEKFPAKGKTKTTYRIKPEYLDTIESEDEEEVEVEDLGEDGEVEA